MAVLHKLTKTAFDLRWRRISESAGEACQQPAPPRWPRLPYLISAGLQNAQDNRARRHIRLRAKGMVKIVGYRDGEPVWEAVETKH
jgi:hypothetical protein